ncbi:MAG: DUF368 domain-containing protein [Micromonosporaceae bacterium]|nr:DUF368 domain-containing protein [Micromonosporaceae bacterium]
MGVAEGIPGVSGGTIALVLGVYESLIISAGHVVSGVRLAVSDLPRGRGLARAAAEFRQARWRVVIPVGIGMLCLLVIAARVIEPLLHDYPHQTRGLFLGLVLASLWVPMSMIKAPWRPREIVAAVSAAVGAFVLTGLPPGEVAATPVIVFLAAAVAVCALTLPGVSGSFILLTIGLYAPTLAAVNQRDYGYLGVFAAGALVGLALFVKLLQWLLEHRRRITLALLTGLIAGSLRALWPWQTEERALLSPDENVASTATLFVIGAGIVIGLMLVERRVAGSATAHVEHVADDGSPTADSGQSRTPVR